VQTGAPCAWCGDTEIRQQMMETAVRISESEAALENRMISNVLIEPEVRAAFDAACWRTSGSGH
jgi:hypothetical protein